MYPWSLQDLYFWFLISIVVLHADVFTGRWKKGLTGKCQNNTFCGNGSMDTSLYFHFNYLLYCNYSLYPLLSYRIIGMTLQVQVLKTFDPWVFDTAIRVHHLFYSNQSSFFNCQFVSNNNFINFQTSGESQLVFSKVALFPISWFKHFPTVSLKIGRIVISKMIHFTDD